MGHSYGVVVSGSSVFGDEVLEKTLDRTEGSEVHLRRIGIINLGVLCPIINTDQSRAHHRGVVEDERSAQSLPDNVASRPRPGLKGAQPGVIDEVKEAHCDSLSCLSPLVLKLNAMMSVAMTASTTSLVGFGQICVTGLPRPLIR